mmetsp:Transcript_8445/g.24986  ORF Transcript_8445/g.24986 Transcript_8445/m.24986 type:complete len:91 (+) Transcript_8445:340-612(+)
MVWHNLDGTGAATTNCEEYCAKYSSPVVKVEGENLKSLIAFCTDNVENYCPFLDVPVSCWNTSKITDMSYAFENSLFNERLDFWDVSQVV